MVTVRLRQGFGKIKPRQCVVRAAMSRTYSLPLILIFMARPHDQALRNVLWTQKVAEEAAAATLPPISKSAPVSARRPKEGDEASSAAAATATAPTLKLPSLQVAANAVRGMRVLEEAAEQLPPNLAGGLAPPRLDMASIATAAAAVAALPGDADVIIKSSRGKKKGKKKEQHVERWQPKVQPTRRQQRASTLPFLLLLSSPITRVRAHTWASAVILSGCPWSAARRRKTARSRAARFPRAAILSPFHVKVRDGT